MRLRSAEIKRAFDGYNHPAVNKKWNGQKQHYEKDTCVLQVSLLGTGGDLLFRAVSSQVPSALKGLTSVFGMRTGGAPSPLPPVVVQVGLYSPQFGMGSFFFAFAHRKLPASLGFRLASSRFCGRSPSPPDNRTTSKRESLAILHWSPEIKPSAY